MESSENPVPQIVYIRLESIKKKENIWFFQLQNGNYNKIKLTDLLESCPGCGGGPIKWSGIRNKRRSDTVTTLRCNRQGRGRCDHTNACRRTATRNRMLQLQMADKQNDKKRTEKATKASDVDQPFVNFMNINLMKRPNDGPCDEGHVAKLRKNYHPSISALATYTSAVLNATEKSNVSGMHSLAAAAAQQKDKVSDAMRTLSKTADDPLPQDISNTDNLTSRVMPAQFRVPQLHDEYTMSENQQFLVTRPWSPYYNKLLTMGSSTFATHRPLANLPESLEIHSDELRKALHSQLSAESQKSHPLHPAHPLHPPQPSQLFQAAKAAQPAQPAQTQTSPPQTQPKPTPTETEMPNYYLYST